MVIIWDEQKNIRLKSDRGICFEDVKAAWENGQVLEDAENPVRPGQRILVVRIKGYVCVAPYVTDGQNMFLKTLYQSRKYSEKFGEPDGKTEP